MKNSIITHAAEAIDTAQKNLEQIQDTVHDKNGELAKARAERDRLQELIVKGDTAAMTQIVDARAEIDGLTIHLQDLNKALAGAEQNHRVAIAQHQRARAEALDVDGILTNEEVATAWAEIAEQIDALVHPLLADIDGHNTAIHELGNLVDESNKILGGSANQVNRPYTGSTEANWVSIDGHGQIQQLTSAAIFEHHIGKSTDRYKAERNKELLERSRAQREKAAEEDRHYRETVVYL